LSRSNQCHFGILEGVIAQLSLKVQAIEKISNYRYRDDFLMNPHSILEFAEALQILRLFQLRAGAPVQMPIELL
jgi:hypothetical protein